MPRGNSNNFSNQHPVQPDTIYKSELVMKLANSLMRHGKKQCALKIVYIALNCIQEQLNKQLISTQDIANENRPMDDVHFLPHNKQLTLKVFKKSIENITPRVEVRSQRTGGVTHQAPTTVNATRGICLAFRFIKKDMKIRMKNTAFKPGDNASGILLGAVLIDSYDNKGGAVKMCADMYRMANANRAYANTRITLPT